LEVYRLFIDNSLMIGNNQRPIKWYPSVYTHWFHWHYWCNWVFMSSLIDRGFRHKIVNCRIKAGINLLVHISAYFSLIFSANFIRSACLHETTRSLEERYKLEFSSLNQAYSLWEKISVDRQFVLMDHNTNKWIL